LLELARREKTDVHETFRAITEAGAVVLDVARVSIWQLCGDRNAPGWVQEARLVCDDLYLLMERKHVSAGPIHGRDFPTYLQATHERRTITADDARHDPRTSEFAEFYLKPLGIRSMMDVPIWHRGEVYGVICFEHVGPFRQWRAEEQDFAIIMADIASTSLEAAERLSVDHRWETAIETVTEAVALFDARGTMVHCNEAARQYVDLAGGRSQEGAAATIEFVDAADRPIPPEDWPFQRVLRHEKVQGEIYGILFKTTGERRYVRLSCSPIIQRAQIVYVALVLLDATDEMHVERLKRDVLSTLAHELKTPLAIASGYAQALDSSSELPATARPMLDAILRACDRLDHLSQTVIDLASTMLGRLRLTRERVDLSELLLSVVRRAERGAPNHRLKVTIGEHIPVIVDCTRIAQAMRQLIDNAIAYSPAGTTVDVELSTHGDMACLAVRDRGIGIPAGAQRNTFRLFFTAHAGTEHENGGLGVGLYLAREIVRRHGGDISFESVEGEGSAFYMTLPREGAP
jgi:signal transduction histidine kinase